jgi:hypothetical protein
MHGLPGLAPSVDRLIVETLLMVHSALRARLDELIEQRLAAASPHAGDSKRRTPRVLACWRRGSPASVTTSPRRSKASSNLGAWIGRLTGVGYQLPTDS